MAQDKYIISKDILINQLDSLNISYTLYPHEPIFTVEQGEHLKQSIPGTHCRNLFLRDKKEKMFLITLANETTVDLKALPEMLGCGRLSFGSPERLWTHLGIRPGSVNPFCIANDAGGTVRMILDKFMMDQDIINVHPMDNAWTIGLSPQCLQVYLKHINKAAEILEF